MLVLACTILSTKTNARPSTGTQDREFRLAQPDRIARPVIEDLAHDELKKQIPLVLSKRTDNPPTRTETAYLEAFDRLLNGIAPWLNGEGGIAERSGPAQPMNAGRRPYCPGPHKKFGAPGMYPEIIR